ncbi:MAG TPA: NAD-dependent epimerase/dehydratase family protein [Ktedonobacterales bacterium]|jgi:2'-hydroxyisoflavone reductase|nr:NAD-dependent epimerase/dehydratase family protein [Ktedonobacterales bacterium]
MRILLFGGTGFLGRHLVSSAVARHHTVTLFNRGVTNPDLFPHLEQLHGDRASELQLLRGRVWDAVIDSNGRIPRQVRESAAFMATQTQHYTFISSTSVYADFTVAPIDECSPVSRYEENDSETELPETYGARKALCEHYAEQALPNRVLVIRPGLIAGPYDPTDRFTYWPHRIAQGGQTLAPGDPEQPVQFIDVRDLAAWTIAMVESHQTGVYNAKGPASTLTMRQLLETCREVCGGAAANTTFEWVSERFLLEQGVVPYQELPLWTPSAMVGWPRVNCRKAMATGLSFRPLTETVRDILAWDATRPANNSLRAGLTPEHERQLLRAWHSAWHSAPRERLDERPT